MGYFQVRYHSRVVNYDHRGFMRLATVHCSVVVAFDIRDLQFNHPSFFKQFIPAWAVVVAQLVERLLLIPEVHGSNPVIGKNLTIY